MMNFLGFLSGRFCRFGRSETGAVTVEAVLWLPMFILLIALIADISMVFNGQSRLFRIVQDANRNMSIGRLTTTTSTENFVIAQASGLSSNVTAATTVVAGLITTTVSVPITDLDLFGIAGFVPSALVTVRAEHLMEN